MADAVVAGSLDHKATVEAVAKKRASAKVKGSAKAKAKPVTSRVFRTAPGIRITAERGRGVEPAALLEAVEEVAAILRAELEASRSDEAA